MLYNHQVKDIPTMSDEDLGELRERIAQEWQLRRDARQERVKQQQLADTARLYESSAHYRRATAK